MTKVIVIDDAVGWTVKDPDTKQLSHQYGFKGQEVDIPDHEIARHQKHTEKDGRPRVGTAEEYEDWTAEQALEEMTPGELSDAQLTAMTPDQLVAAMNQNNGIAERVLELEDARPGRNRKPIVDHAQRLIDARAEFADELQPAAD